MMVASGTALWWLCFSLSAAKADKQTQTDRHQTSALHLSTVSKMFIYIAHLYTSNVLNTVMVVEKERLQWPPEWRLDAVRISELVWSWVPESGSSKCECPMAECPTSMAWCGQQAMMCRTTGDVFETGTQQSTPDTVALYCGDISGLLHQACTGPSWSATLS